MSGKRTLAFRNVRRQIGNYLIYFFTVSLTVALLFAINNMIFGKELKRYIDTTDDFRYGMGAAVVLISLITAFVLGYATSFMLKLRKREFGTYLTLGMSRRDLLSIFLTETMLICVIALGSGILLGLFIYQGFMAVIMHFMEMDFLFSRYSMDGLIFTVVLVAGIFLIACAASSFYLKKVRIYQLIYEEKKAERPVRAPFLWLLVCLLSFALILYCCYAFQKEVASVFLDHATGTEFAKILAMFACSVALFYIGMARSFVSLLLKRSLCFRGTNTFVLRQLSGTLNSNSVLIGLLAVLLAFAVIGVNASFLQRASETALLYRNYPFDLLYREDVAQRAAYGTGAQKTAPAAEAEQVIQAYTAVSKKLTYTFYCSGKADLYAYSKWSGAGYDGLMDSYLKESDFNAIMAFLGKEPVELDGEFLIVTNNRQASQYAWRKAVFSRNGRTYRAKGVMEDCPILHYVYFFAVIPDEAANGMEAETTYTAYHFGSASYHALSLKKELNAVENKAGFCHFSLREYGRYEQNSVAAILTVGALFASLVFLLLAMAVLALKMLSGIAEDRRRYQILFQIGAGEAQRSRTLFLQTFCFFFLPFSGAVLVNIPTGIICAQIVRLSGISSLAGDTYLTAAAVSFVMTGICVFYYIITYLTAKRSVIERRRCI
ncbi:MAG: ABC transporter permease [Eubacterium sp.]|nr:ABC transporter permease [Eubacterium sp.]